MQQLRTSMKKDGHIIIAKLERWRHLEIKTYIDWRCKATIRLRNRGGVWYHYLLIPIAREKNSE